MHFLALLLVCLLMMWCTPLRRGLPVDIPQLWAGFAARRLADRPLLSVVQLSFKVAGPGWRVAPLQRFLCITCQE